jgi:hypothetical protein
MYFIVSKGEMFSIYAKIYNAPWYRFRHPLCVRKVKNGSGGHIFWSSVHVDSGVIPQKHNCREISPSEVPSNMKLEYKSTNIALMSTSLQLLQLTQL